jgi:hypothetical protein
MAKYEVKDINKNGKIDNWEQAKYDVINKSADSPAKANCTGSPNKFIGGSLRKFGAIGSIARGAVGVKARGGLMGGEGMMTSDGYMSSADLEASQAREAARRAQRAEEIQNFIASKQNEINATPQTSFATQEQAAGGAENLARLQSLKTMGQVGRQAQELTNIPPASAAANAMQPVFSESVTKSANQIYGDMFARQNAVGAPPLFKKKCNKYKK